MEKPSLDGFSLGHIKKSRVKLLPISKSCYTIVREAENEAENEGKVEKEGEEIQTADVIRPVEC